MYNAGKTPISQILPSRTFNFSFSTACTTLFFRLLLAPAIWNGYWRKTFIAPSRAYRPHVKSKYVYERYAHTHTLISFTRKVVTFLAGFSIPFPLLYKHVGSYQRKLRTFQRKFRCKIIYFRPSQIVFKVAS